VGRDGGRSCRPTGLRHLSRQNYREGNGATRGSKQGGGQRGEVDDARARCCGSAASRSVRAPSLPLARPPAPLKRERGIRQQR